MRVIFILVSALAVAACATHREPVCIDLTSRAVCFDERELATVVALDECLEEPFDGAYNDHVAACGARALEKHDPDDPSRLWYDLVELYTDGEDDQEIISQINAALFDSCERERGAGCDRYL